MIRIGSLALVAAVVSADHARSEPLPRPPAFSVCGACHVTEKGRKPTIGPNLFGVSERKSGEYQDFAYSPAMRAAAITWSSENLNSFIKSPAKVVPGTKMFYGGQADDAARGEIVRYLLSLR